ncbi:MAG: ion transporter [Alphaproteobacteria bacterium]|nr:ion transporter [Alphaproteobacteria bacterium]
MAGATAAGLRGRIARFIEAPRAQQAILAVIVLNAVTLGLETSSSAVHTAGGLILALDRGALAIFVAELAAKLYARRGAFFRSGWSVLDLIVVGIGLVPARGGLTVLRLVSGVPSMRKVVQALLAAIPGLGSIIALLGLVYYVASVIATKLFGTSFTEWFGSVGESAPSLFQIMTLESWSMGVVRPVMEVYPQAWPFFVAFILLASFAVLNLFIAIIVNAVQGRHDAELREAADKASDLAALRSDVARIEAMMRERR